VPGPDTAPVPLPALGETPVGTGASLDTSAFAGRRPPSLATSAVSTGVGLVVVLVALWGVRSWSAPWRTVLGLAGATVLWLGLDRLGKIRFGRSFRLGVWVALAWLVLVVVLAVGADLLPLEDINHPEATERLARPALEWSEPLGRDDFGRSLLSRTIYGARASLTIGLLSAALGLAAGGLLGLLAGYYRRTTDAVITTVGNALLAFPPLVLLLAIVSIYAKTETNLALGLAVLFVPTFMRLARAQTLVIAEREFVTAAREMGARDRRILMRDIVPNIVMPLLSYAFLVLGVAIVAEGSLSYVGLGIQAPEPSWGGMVAKGQPLLKTSPHVVFVPAVALFLTVLSINRVGDALRRRVGGGSGPL
jgi:peptide/nickel transport system permease protein